MTDNASEERLKTAMKKVEDLIKIEAKKRETVGTIGKLLKMSKDQEKCYLCK